MSTQAARALADRMNLKEVLIAEHYSGLMSDLQMLAEADHGLEDAAAEASRPTVLANYGYGNRTTADSKPFAYADGVAIIPVQGTLINRFSSSWGWITGYNFIRAQLNAALADDDVTLIVFDVNSYGGEAAGCFELCEDIFESRAVKPSIAVVDSNSFSAGFAIASSASKVYLTPSGGVGSIGVVVMHVNMGPMLKDVGYEVTFIKSGEHKTDGNPYEALPAPVKASIQANVDQSREVFVALVARNRGIEASAVKATEAGCFRADEALSIGLIDAVEPPSKVIAAYFLKNELSGSDDEQTQEQINMATTTAAPGAITATPAADAATPVTIEQATAAGATAERERSKGILNSEEAKSRPALANHLALSTSLSVEDAVAMMKIAAVETPATAAAPAAKGANAFAEAMDTTGNPKVGAGDGTTEQAGATDTQSKVARIIANQAMATGVKRS